MVSLEVEEMVVEEPAVNPNDTFNPDDVFWAVSSADVEALALRLELAELVTYDLETTGLDEWAEDAEVVLAQYTLDDDDRVLTWLVPLCHPESPHDEEWREVFGRLTDALVVNKTPLEGHNIKFDMRWTYAHTGTDLSGQVFWDTQVSSHLLDENRSTRLKKRAAETFSIEEWDDFDLSKPGAAKRVDLETLGMYGARDTYWTHRLGENHRRRMFLTQDSDEPIGPEEVQEARLGRLALYCSMPTVATLTEMEQRGIGVDLDWIEERIASDEAVVEANTQVLIHRYLEEGEEPPRDKKGRPAWSFAPTATYFRNWSAKAVEAGDLVVTSLTATGKPQWTKEVLAKQARAGSEVAEWLLELRQASKRLEFLRVWKTLVGRDGRIHSTYHSSSVVSGRLSSSSPNMQQVTKSLRPAFVPVPGRVIVDLDYSQIELRVAAYIARSEPMLQAYRDGQDLHTIMAAAIVRQGRVNDEVDRRMAADPTLDRDRVHAEVEEQVQPDLTSVTKVQRQAGKAANFGLLYGMGSYGFQIYAEDVYGVSFTEQEAVDVHRAFFDTWDGLRQWHAKVVARLPDTGEVTSPIGRVRRLPGVWSEGQRGSAERQAINSPVQGFASDLMQMSAASIAGKLPGIPRVEGADLVGTVHDSIVLEVDEERWREIVAECQRRMVRVVDYLASHFHVTMDVPLEADASVSTRWGLGDLSDA